MITTTTTTVACACCSPTVTPSCDVAYLRTLPATITMAIAGITYDPAFAAVKACCDAANGTVTLHYTETPTATSDGFIVAGIPGWYLIVDCSTDSCCGGSHLVRMYKLTCAGVSSGGVPQWSFLMRFPVDGGSATEDAGGTRSGNTPIGSYPEGDTGPDATTPTFTAS